MYLAHQLREMVTQRLRAVPTVSLENHSGTHNLTSSPTTRQRRSPWIRGTSSPDQKQASYSPHALSFCISFDSTTLRHEYIKDFGSLSFPIQVQLLEEDTLVLDLG